MSIVAKRSLVSATAELLFTAHGGVCPIYFALGSPVPPSKLITRSNEDLHAPRLIHGSLGPPVPSGIGNGSSLFAALTTVTDRQTERQATILGL